MQLWDAYRRDGSRAGIDLTPGEPIPEDLYHAVVETVVRHRDGSFLLTRRAETDQLYPNLCLPGTVGDVVKNETFAMAARRLLESDASIESIQVEPMYRVLDHETHTLYVGFLHTTGAVKDSLTPNADVISEYNWVTPKELRKAAKEGQFPEELLQRLIPYLSRLS